jgi:hypothetical protein
MGYAKGTKKGWEEVSYMLGVRFQRWHTSLWSSLHGYKQLSYTDFTMWSSGFATFDDGERFRPSKQGVKVKTGY